MELSELFEKYSIEDIAKKTNIPQEKLESLKEKKWEDFRKPQVIGFLNILQREFKADLSDEINEAKEYFKEHQVEKAIASIDMVDSTVSIEHRGYFITKLIYLLTIAALAYAGWYYYNKESSPQIEIKDDNSSIISDSISSVKDLLGMDSNAKLNENNSSNEANKTTSKEPKEEVKTSIISNSENKVEKNQSSKEDDKKDKFNINIPQPSANNSTLDVTSKSNQEQQSVKIENNSIKKAVDTLLEENDSLKNAQDKNRSALASNSSQGSILDTQNSENNTSAKENENSEIKLDLPTNQESESINLDTTAFESATIIPDSKKLWVGVYNLKTQKKENKILNRGQNMELNLDDGNYAVVTGHNKVKVKIGDEEKKFPKKGKVYLLLSKDEGVKILTRKEYREITNKRAW